MSKKAAREWMAAIMICVFGTFLIGGLIAALECHGYASSEAAGWMQAIGSVVAIAVAIWVMNEQHRRDAVRRENEDSTQEARLLRSIRTEVRVLLTLFHGRVGDALLHAPKGSIFDVIYRTQPNPFSVYDSNVGQLGIVRDDEVRALVIEAYARFNGFLAVISLNNELVQEKANERRASGFKLSEDRSREYDLRLRHTGDQIVDRYKEVRDISERIDSALARY